MKRVFLLLGGGLLLGSFAASLSDNRWMPLALAALSLTVGIWLARKRTLWWSALFLLCLWGGFFRFTASASFYQPLDSLAGQTVSVRGVVEQMIRKPNGHYQYRLRTELDGRSFVLQLSTPGEIPDAETGSRVELSCVLNSPPESSWFDGRRYYYSQNIRLLGYLQNPESAVVGPMSEKSLTLGIRQCAQRYLDALRANPRLSDEVSGVLESMVLGSRTNLDPVLQQSYTNAGAAHLFAVSGMHLMALVSVLLLLLPRRHPWLRLLAVTAVILCYTVWSGGHLSTVRSGWMLWMQLLAPCFHRQNDGVNSLFFAGFWMVLLEPFAIMDLGFLLSFSAMLGLTALYPAVRRALDRHRAMPKGLRKVVHAVCATLCVQLAVFPLTLWQFGCFSLMTPVSNLLLTPLLAPIVLLGICYVLTLPLGDVALLRLVLSALVEIQNRLAERLGSVPHSIIGLGHRCYLVWALAAAVIVAALWLGKKPGLWRKATLYLAILFVFFTGIAQWELSREETLYLFSDGEGCSLVLCYHGETAVLALKDDDYIDTVLLRFLQQKGISSIDAYVQLQEVLTAPNDTRRLLTGIPVKTYYYPETGVPPRLETNVPLRSFSAEDQITSMLGCTMGQTKTTKGSYVTLSAAGLTFAAGKASVLTDAPEDTVLLLTSLSANEELYREHLCFLLNTPVRSYPEADYVDATDGIWALELSPQSFAYRPVS